MDGSYWRDIYARAYAGRAWIAAVDAAAGATRLTATLGELGAGPFLVLAASPGTGDLPDSEIAVTIMLGTGGDSMLDSLRRFHAALADLPADVVARIDEWDPVRQARVLNGFMPADAVVAGRRLYGAREPAWIALEDKIAVESLWDAVGVRRAPSAIVPSRLTDLRAAAGRLDAGRGTVWAADNREGWHGGAEYVRWVRSAEDAEAAAGFFAACSDRVRVMPFLDGIPCSVHAVVFPTGIATFRPAEMIVLRRAGSSHLEYSGVATVWDAPEADAAYMREVVRRVATHLRDTVGYRGAFGIDGVLTAGGFLPTELNARFTGGLGLQVQPVEELSMWLLNIVLVAGEEADYRPADFEELVLAASADRRGGWILMKVPGPAPEATLEQPVAFAGGEVRPVADADEADAVVQFGPAASGGMVMCRLEPGAVEPGPSVGPLAIEICKLAGELWGLEVADLEPASVSRARTPPGSAARSR